MRRQTKPLRRGYGRREERQRFLIYCEGELTEITYFKGVRRELRASTVRLEIVAGRGEPYGLVEKAVDHQRRAPRSEADGFEPYDQVWCVFDVEAPRPHARLAAALALARRNRVHCAIFCYKIGGIESSRNEAEYRDIPPKCNAYTITIVSKDINDDGVAAPNGKTVQFSQHFSHLFGRCG